MLRTVLAFLVTAALVPGGGCRYNNLLSRGPEGVTPYVNLQCFEPGNDLGFSFELPGCVCENGIRLRYVGRRAKDGSYVIYYEQERGYLSGSPADLIVMRSSSMDRVEELHVGGRRLPPLERASPREREVWQLASENWVTSFQLYQARVMRDAFRVCQEDREQQEHRAISMTAQ